MNNNYVKEAENFYKSFIKSTDLQGTLEKYRKFAEKAIKDPLQYAYLVNKFRDNGETKENWQSWKQVASDTFLRIVDIYSAVNNSADRSLQQVKDPLVYAILDILGDNARRIHGKPQYETDMKIRFAVLDLVLDLGFSFSQSPYERICYSSLLWNVVRKVSESRKEYDDFYGKAAEDKIIGHTRTLLELTDPNPGMGNRVSLENILRSNTGNQQLREFVSDLLYCYPEKKMDQGVLERKPQGERKMGRNPWSSILLAVIVIVLLLIACIALFQYFQGKEAVLQRQENTVEIMQEAQQELERENQRLTEENRRLEEESQRLIEENQTLGEEADTLRDELAQIREQRDAEAEMEYYSYDSDIY